MLTSNKLVRLDQDERLSLAVPGTRSPSSSRERTGSSSTVAWRPGARNGSEAMTAAGRAFREEATDVVDACREAGCPSAVSRCFNTAFRSAVVGVPAAGAGKHTPTTERQLRVDCPADRASLRCVVRRHQTGSPTTAGRVSDSIQTRRANRAFLADRRVADDPAHRAGQPAPPPGLSEPHRLGEPRCAPATTSPTPAVQTTAVAMVIP